MVTSIILSTGKVVRIPIFPAIPLGEGNVFKITRANGIIRDYYNNPAQIVFSVLTDSELIELSNVLFNGQSQTLVNNVPSLSVGGGHACCLINWVYDSSTDKMLLNTYVTYNKNSRSTIVDYHTFDSQSGPYYYDSWNRYNSPTSSPQFPYKDFNELLVKGAVFTQSCVNIRPSSSSIYSIDIIVKDFSSDPYTYTCLTGRGMLSEDDVLNNIQAYISANPDSGVDYIETENSYENPYGIVISEGGGGDGYYELNPDSVEKAEIPDLPTISAVDAGLITLYNCTNGQLQALGNYLWSNVYDLETNFTKLFASPMESIIGLSILPVLPQLAGASSVKFGNIDTHVAMTKLSSQFVEKDMGSISIKKWIGSFLDYSPYVKLSLYLPYIGFRDISPDDVIGDSIHIVYHIDCLTGGCCAFVETGKKGLLYQFNGSCSCNVPVTAINYSGAIQNAVSAVGAGLTTVAGVATGTAPLTAVGVAQLATNGANTALNSKPTVQRSGAMGGAAGLMSYQRPMLIIERPNMCVPENLNTYIGNMLYVTMNLNRCKGFTQIELIHLDGISCTDNEREELEKILKEGVIF